MDAVDVLLCRNDRLVGRVMRDTHRVEVLLSHLEGLVRLAKVLLGRGDGSAGILERRSDRLLGHLGRRVELAEAPRGRRASLMGIVKRSSGGLLRRLEGLVQLGGVLGKRGTRHRVLDMIVWVLS